MKFFYRHWQNQNGFVFTKTVSAVIIAGLLVAVATEIVGTETVIYARSFTWSKLWSEARKAVPVINDESKTNALDSIITVQANTLVFKNFDKDTLSCEFKSDFFTRESQYLFNNLQAAPVACLNTSKNTTIDPDSVCYFRITQSLYLNNESVRLQEDIYVRIRFINQKQLNFT